MQVLILHHRVMNDQTPIPLMPTLVSNKQFLLKHVWHFPTLLPELLRQGDTKNLITISNLLRSNYARKDMIRGYRMRTGTDARHFFRKGRMFAIPILRTKCKRAPRARFSIHNSEIWRIDIHPDQAICCCIYSKELCLRLVSIACSSPCTFKYHLTSELMRSRRMVIKIS